MGKVQRVSSSEFAGKFGHWSFAAQSAPVMVTDQKTGVVKGYFVSERILRVPVCAIGCPKPDSYGI